MIESDLNRFREASRDMIVRGLPTTHERQKVIEDAIAAIQQDETSLSNGYMGVKNYASFGDQRCDCHYGMGPSHGSIVFSVGRSNPEDKIPLGDDHIFFLECVRDFVPVQLGERKMNMQEVVRHYDDMISQANNLKVHLDALTPETH